MIHAYKDHYPEIAQTAFVAPSADIIGAVTIGEDCSIWYGVVIRADMAPITIGTGANVQDNTVVHVDTDKPTHIGEHVTIGHAAIIHACTIGDYSLIGMGATILDGAQIGHHVIIGANALVAQNKVIPDNSLVFGSPAKVIRPLTAEEIQFLEDHAANYCALSKDYLSEDRNETK